VLVLCFLNTHYQVISWYLWLNCVTHIHNGLLHRWKTVLSLNQIFLLHNNNSRTLLYTLNTKAESWIKYIYWQRSYYQLDTILREGIITLVWNMMILVIDNLQDCMFCLIYIGTTSVFQAYNKYDVLMTYTYIILAVSQ
jgi:hypothetical protein